MEPEVAGRDASRTVLGRGSLYTVGTAAPIIAQVAVTPAVTRLLGPTGYGLVAPSLVVVQVTMMVASLGIPSVITRYALLDRGGIPGARSMLVRGTMLTLGLVVLALAATPLWSRSMGGELRSIVMVALVAGALFVLVEDCQALLRAEDRPVPFIVVSAVAALGGPMTGLALLLAVRPQPVLYLTGLAGGYAVAAGVGLMLCLWRGERVHHHGDLSRGLRLGIPVLPHMVALYLANGALVFVAGKIYGDVDAGRLQLALFLGSSPAVVTSALNNSWAPAVFRAAPDHRAAVVHDTAVNLARLSGLVAGGVSLLSPWLLRFVADSRYAPEELVAPVAVVAVGAMLSVGYLANVHLVFAQGRSLGLSVTTPLALVAGLVVATTAGQLSLVGVALGFPATYGALVVLTAVLRRQVGGPAWGERSLLVPFGIGACFIAAGGILPTTGPGALARPVAAVLAGVLVLRLLHGVFRGVGTAGRPEG